jgi:hypothetical protein
LDELLPQKPLRGMDVSTRHLTRISKKLSRHPEPAPDTTAERGKSSMNKQILPVECFNAERLKIGQTIEYTRATKIELSAEDQEYNPRRLYIGVIIEFVPEQEAVVVESTERKCLYAVFNGSFRTDIERVIGETSQ